VNWNKSFIVGLGIYIAVSGSTTLLAFKAHGQNSNWFLAAFMLAVLTILNLMAFILIIKSFSIKYRLILGLILCSIPIVFFSTAYLYSNSFFLRSDTFVPSQEVRSGTRIPQNNESINYEVPSSGIKVNSFKGITFQIKKFQIPNAVGYNYGRKAAGFLVDYENDFLLIQGDGSILKFSEEGIKNNDLILKSIPSNLDEVLDSEITMPNSMSIRGAAIGDSFIWISVTKKVKRENLDNCFTTAIYKGTFNNLNSTSEVNFKPFFVPNECYEGDPNSPFQTGGAIKFVKPNEILNSIDTNNYIVFAIGNNWKNPERAQDPKSVLGGVVALPTQSERGEFSLLAKGLRNPQSIAKFGNLFCLTEQQDQGGDEINCFEPNLQKMVNFGWPISGYGSNLKNEDIPLMPLLKSHKDYGFAEPSYYWPESSVAPTTIGVSSILSSEVSLIVGTLGYSPGKGAQSISFFRNSAYSKNRLELFDRIPVGIRVRSLVTTSDLSKIIFLDDFGGLNLIEKE
jgi:hypothetical protein